MTLPEKVEKKGWSMLCQNCAYRGDTGRHHAWCSQTEQYVPRKATCDLWKEKKKGVKS